MKTHKAVALLLILAFLLGAFCTGCTKKPAEVQGTPEPTAESTEIPATEASNEVQGTPEPTAELTEIPATEAPDAEPVRMKNGGELSFLPEEPISVPKLSEMVYSRPDTETLTAKIDALIEKLPQYNDAESILNDYYDIAQLRHTFHSMCELAYFHFCMDTSDEYYAEEYDHCDEQYTVVQEKLDSLYAAFAASPFRGALEEGYFGEGFFDDYDGFSEGGDAYLELKQRENDLLFKYYDMRSTADLSTYSSIEETHDSFGNLFIELVKVRQQIAAAKGYDNYMDYIYATEFKRDYSTAQTREFLNGIKTESAPFLDENGQLTNVYWSYSDWSESKALEMLSSAAEKMGGPIWEAFRFMNEYELYDISYSSKKLSTGYTDYLADYEAPIIFIEPENRDLLITLFHEFGHYTDYYCNYGFSGSYDIAEIYSQAMQYLAFKYSDKFNDNQREQNLLATLAELSILSILREGAFADFELQVYSLSPDELTVERLDEIYESCMEEYGLKAFTGVYYTKIYWSAYGHFYSAPGYVISYSVSAVVALQICRMEAESEGSGVEAFIRLLGHTKGLKFSAALREAELDDPFEKSTIEKAAAFLRKVFDME